MILFLLKLFAFGMIIAVCKQQFPTFLGGFYTCCGLNVLWSISSLFDVRKVEKDGD